MYPTVINLIEGLSPPPMIGRKFMDKYKWNLISSNVFETPIGSVVYVENELQLQQIRIDDNLTTQVFKFEQNLN